MASPDDILDSGLGSDLLGIGSRATPGLGTGLLQGATAGAIAPPAAPQPVNGRATDQNIQLLGRVLSSECQGVCHPEEIQAVGSTLVNRMNRAKTDDVADVTHGYALNKDPTPGMMFTAMRLLSGQLPDNTGGATNFYSPQSMPVVGADVRGMDISGGPEQIPGHPATWTPGFAKSFPQTTVPGVRDWIVKLYTQPGNGRVH